MDISLLPIDLSDLTKCPHCGGNLISATTINHSISKWFMECSNFTCNTIVNTKFSPTDYQLHFLNNSKQNLAYFGGYGAGKSLSGAFKIFLHLVSVPNAFVLAGSVSWDMNIKTIMNDMTELVPQALLDHYGYSFSVANGNYSLRFLNGSYFNVLVFVKEEKLRSFNLTAAWIEEASEVKYGIYNQLKARLRADAGRVFEKDGAGNIIQEVYIDSMGVKRSRNKELESNYLLLITSNPDPGWIRTQVASKTLKNNLHYYGPNQEVVSTIYKSILKLNDWNFDPFTSTYIVSTRANYHLPFNFINQLSAGKTQAWIDRYIEGSFAFADGMVYPEYFKNIVEPFKIPEKWKRIISTDFGRRDATAHLIAAQNPQTKVWYIYGEYLKYQGDIDHWVAGFKKLYDAVPISSWMMSPIADPSGQNRGQAIDTSWFNLYAEKGILFIPWLTGLHQQIGISAGIAKVHKYFQNDKLKIFRSLNEFIQEIQGYVYKTSSLMEDDDGQINEIPRDYQNHLMDCLRGFISVLPSELMGDVESYVSNYTLSKGIILDHFDVEEATNNHDPSSPKFWALPKKEEYNNFASSESDEDIDWDRMF